MRAWRTICPAKINLFLSVGPPDRRGYHPLRTVFQAVSLFDTLEVHVAKADHLVEPTGMVPPDNTLTKTLRLLRELLPVPPLEITLTKVIPSQAGLGGGSSDAAGLIRVVQAMLPDDFPEHFAFEVAEAVGADVPFFLVGGRARGEGYGQVLTPMPDPGFVPLMIVKPSVDCATPAAFQRLDQIPREWREFPDDAEQFGFNDFESVAPEPSRRLIDDLKKRGHKAMLTGSGSAVVCLGGTPGDEEPRLRAEGHWTASAHFIGRAASLAVEELT